MTEFNINANATISININGDEEILTVDFSFGYSDVTSLEELKQHAADLLLEEWSNEHATPVDISLNGIDIEITDYDGVNDDYSDFTKAYFWEYLEACYESDSDSDIVAAALYCGVSPSDIDEAYSGSFTDDEDFAKEMAEELGAIDKNASWPMNCIDWECAAKELMYDYSEHNGHYFRNL